MDNTESNETLCRFRRQKLTELQHRLASCAAGHTHAVMPFITDRYGRYSEKKTMQLVNQFICFPETETVSDTLCSFYKSILYCTLRAFSTPCTIQQGSTAFGVYNPDFTFGDLICCLHSEKLEYSENDGSSMSFGILHQPLSGFLSMTMTALYTFLSRKSAPVPNPLDGWFDPHETFTTEDDCFMEAADPLELWALDDIPYSEEESCQIKGSFPFPGKYCEHYENLLTLFPGQYQKETFDRHMEYMINRFLTKQNMTVFSDKDTYLTAIIYLKKALKIMQDSQMNPAP